jgi:STE24 endopeptidase
VQRRLTRGLAAAGLIALAAAIVYTATRLWHTSVPGDLHLPAVDASREVGPHALHRAKSFAALLRVLFVASEVVLIAVLVVYARRGTRLLRQSAAGPLGSGFLLGMLGLGIVWIAQLPFDLIELWWGRDHHVIKTGFLEALLAEWTGLGGRFVFLCAALLVAMGLARLLRWTWWVPAGAAFGGLVLLFAFVGPWIAPGLHRPPPRMRAAAAHIAAAEGVSGVPLRVEKVHDVTTSPNAYSFGLGPSRRVVLWDTIARFPAPQVDVTIAHEYGHQRHDHIRKQVLWYLLLVLPTGFAVMLATRRRGGLGCPEAVPLALLVVVVVQLVATPLQSAVSRRYEAEADWTALNTTHDPQAMIGLMRHFVSAGLADPDPPGWFATLFEDHPTLVDRIAMARAWEAREH